MAALLRHTLATLAYSGGKAVREAPASFAEYAGGTRKPVQILAHVGDLMDWALSFANGEVCFRKAPDKPEECSLTDRLGFYMVRLPQG